MGGGLIDALDITVPEGVVDHIDDAGGRRIWERCELRGLAFDGEVAAKGGVRRGCVTMVGGKTFRYNQYAEHTASMNRLGSTVSLEDDGRYVTTTITSKSSANGIRPTTMFGVVPNHVYICAVRVLYQTDLPKAYLRFGYSGTHITLNSTVTIGSWNTVISRIKTVGSPAASYLYIYLSAVQNTQDEALKEGDKVIFDKQYFNVFDLTETFGAGSEPATVDAAIAAYKLLGIDITQPQEYDPGSIKHASVESVVTRGGNLLDNFTNYADVFGATVTKVGDSLHITGTASESRSSIRARFYYVDESEFKETLNYGVFYNGSLRSCDAEYVSGKYYMIASISLSSVEWVSAKPIDFYLYPVAWEGSAPTAYTPYRAPITRPIPDAVKALPGYGWSAGTAYNHIERTDTGWQYVQEVGEADLGDLTYTRVTSGTNPYYRFEVAGRKTGTDVLQSVYNGVRFASLSAFSGNPSGTLGASTSNQYLAIRDDNYDTANALKAALSGKKCYYELDAPVITDITDMMTDFDWEHMAEGDRYEIVEPSGIQVPGEAAYFVRYGTAAWASTPSLDDGDEFGLAMASAREEDGMIGVEPENMEEE